MTLNQVKAIILAAGKSSRFAPFNFKNHKSFFTICGKPVIVHYLENLKKHKIAKVALVVGPSESGGLSIKKKLNAQENFSSFIQFYEEPQQLGMGKAVLSAQNSASDPFFVLNPYHLNLSSKLNSMLTFQQRKKAGAVICCQETNRSSLYGILETDSHNKIIKIHEKPSSWNGINEPLRIVGQYLFSHNFINYLEKTPLSDYQFENALNEYVKDFPCYAFPIKEKPISLKYSWHLFSLKDLLLEKLPNTISPTAEIDKTAKIEGPVFIGDKAKILEFATIKGPAYIGQNSLVGSYSLVRENTCLEENTKIGCFTEIKNSILGPDSTLHSGFLGDSIVGSNCHIGAQFCSANRRLDRQEIYTLIKKEKVNTGLTYLGTMIGDKSHLGIGVKTMPGVIIKAKTNLTPGTIQYKNIS